MTKPKTARSYRGSIIDDNAVISLNIKWALQAGAAIAALIYGWFQMENRLRLLEENMDAANDKITELVNTHIEDSQIRYEQMEEELKWYQKNINPFAKKRK
jgi:hypothetical protein